jgi:hypothetical protein
VGQLARPIVEHVVVAKRMLVPVTTDNAHRNKTIAGPVSWLMMTGNQCFSVDLSHRRERLRLSEFAIRGRAMSVYVTSLATFHRNNPIYMRRPVGAVEAFLLDGLFGTSSCPRWFAMSEGRNNAYD